MVDLYSQYLMLQKVGLQLFQWTGALQGLRLFKSDVSGPSLKYHHRIENSHCYYNLNLNHIYSNLLPTLQKKPWHFHKLIADCYIQTVISHVFGGTVLNYPNLDFCNSEA